MIEYITKKLRNFWYIVDDYIGWPKMVLIVLATVAAVTYGITYTDHVFEIAGVYSAIIALIFGLYKTTPKDRISGSFSVCVQAISKEDYEKRSKKPIENTQNITDFVLQLHLDMNIINNGHNLVHMGLRDVETGNTKIQFGILHIIGKDLIPMQFDLYKDTNFILTKGNDNLYYYDFWFGGNQTPPLQSIKVEVFTKTGKSVYLKPQKNTPLIVVA